MTAMIYLDADACPVKEQVYRVAARYGIPVSVVANAHLRLPQLAGLNAKVVVVPNTPDAADDWIVEQAKPGDLVLTADIPLAARVIPNGVPCYDFRGGEFHPNGIGEALAARDLNAQLRSMGFHRWTACFLATRPLQLRLPPGYRRRTHGESRGKY